MKNFRLTWTLITVLVCLGSLSHAQSVLEIQSKTGIVPVTHEGLQAVLWMQTSAEYRILCKMTFNQAKQALDTALANKNWTACLEQSNDFSGLPPALIMDIDETVLDNSPFQGEVAKKDVGFDPHLWSAWVKLQKAEGVPGALDFIAYAQSKGVTVFFITNRDISAEDATRKNLIQLGVKIPEAPDTLLMQKEKPAWSTSDKSARRTAVAKTHRILLLVGDDLGDFVSVTNDSPARRIELAEQNIDKWGKGWFLLPNPAYGSWEGSIYSFNYALKRPEILKIKWDLLKGF